jgi:dodecin
MAPRAQSLADTTPQGASTMAVSKVIDLIGNSTVSWEDAARNALAGASKSLHGISDLEIVQFTAKVVDNEIVEYRAMVKLAFVVD